MFAAATAAAGAAAVAVAAAAAAATAAATVPLELSGWLVDGQPQMDGPLVDGNRHSFLLLISSWAFIISFTS